MNGWDFSDKHFVGLFALVVIVAVLAAVAAPSIQIKWPRKRRKVSKPIEAPAVHAEEDE